MVRYQNFTRKPKLFRASLGPGTMYSLNPSLAGPGGLEQTANLRGKKSKRQSESLERGQLFSELGFVQNKSAFHASLYMIKLNDCKKLSNIFFSFTVTLKFDLWLISKYSFSGDHFLGKNFLDF